MLRAVAPKESAQSDTHSGEVAPKRCCLRVKVMV